MQTNLRLPQHLFAQPVQYEIPAFQRRYVWEQEQQWEPLWDDVENLAQNILGGDQEKPHFMGAVVLQQKPYPAGTIERRIVVDGQQRLITLQLLIDAIQEVLEKREHTDPARRLTALVMNRDEFRDGKPEIAFKVWPTIADREAFQHAMRNDLPSATHAKARIVQAHEFFKKQVELWLDKYSGDDEFRAKAASALENAVRMNLELVVIDLDATDDQHAIFEALNARGTPLLESDMVKNKILNDAGFREEDENDASITQLWPFDNDSWWSEEVGRGVQRRPRIDVYLNYWLTLRNSKETKARDEFKAFRKYADHREKAGKTIHEIAKDMKEIGEIYRDIEATRHEDEDIKKFLDRRKTMNAGAVTPLLLWLLSEDMPKKTLKACIKALESFLVRRVVCSCSTQGYGKLFVSLLAKMHKSPNDQADDILISHLAKQTTQVTRWPSDEELQKEFVEEPLYWWLTIGRLRMVIMGIEEQLRTNHTETQKVPSGLQIEHVMPQAWRANWPIQDSGDESEENRERSINMIGNLTLVKGSLNSSLSNSPWESKRKALAKHSTLFLNKRLVEHEVWNDETIKERSKHLAELAAQAWPRPNAKAY